MPDLILGRYLRQQQAATGYAPPSWPSPSQAMRNKPPMPIEVVVALVQLGDIAEQLGKTADKDERKG